MIVEWLGGPKDGEQFEMPIGARYIRMVLPDLRTDFRAPPDPMDLGVMTFHIPIQVRADGRYVAVWPKTKK